MSLRDHTAARFQAVEALLDDPRRGFELPDPTGVLLEVRRCRETKGFSGGSGASESWSCVGFLPADREGRTGGHRRPAAPRPDLGETLWS